MNRLRDLLDSDLSCVHALEPNEAYAKLWAAQRSSGAAAFRKLAEQAIGFWLGDGLEWMKAYEMRPDPLRMPYRCVWVEWHSAANNCPFGVLAYSNSDGSLVDGSCWTRSPRARAWLIVGAFQDLSLTDPWQEATYSGEYARIGQGMLVSFLGMLNLRSVEPVEHRPDAALQRARARRGKQPLFSYWTLDLKRRSGDRVSLGGTHASPRAHLVRGHYKPSINDWIEAYGRGNPRLGVVHKDYDASRLLPC